MVEFRRDLYQGTAADYDRFRPAYPGELIEALLESVDVRGRALDLACGTGQLARPLAEYFARVDAVDREADTVDFAAQRARVEGLDPITWQVDDAENLALTSAYDLIVVGNAFHRLDRAAVAMACYRALVPNGVLALAWGETPLTGDARWQRVAQDVIRVWRRNLDADDRVPTSWRETIDRDPHDAVMARHNFLAMTRREFQARRAWTLDQLLGFVLSTSYLNRRVLGDQVEEFGREWRSAIGRFGDVFEVEMSFALDRYRRT